MPFSELAQRSAAFVANMSKWVEAAILINEKEIVEMNVSQMLNSTKADGSPILPPYTEAYARKKGFSAPNLKVSGDFQDAMKLTVSKDEYKIESEDYKNPFMINFYTTKIFGLTAPHSEQAKEVNGETLLFLYTEWLGR